MTASHMVCNIAQTRQFVHDSITIQYAMLSVQLPRICVSFVIGFSTLPRFDSRTHGTQHTFTFALFLCTHHVKCVHKNGIVSCSIMLVYIRITISCCGAFTPTVELSRVSAQVSEHIFRMKRWLKGYGSIHKLITTRITFDQNGYTYCIELANHFDWPIGLV